MEKGKLVVFYDGECVLCLRTTETLKKLRTTGPIEMIPLQTVRVEQLPPGLTAEQLAGQMHAVDEHGKVYGGAEAVCRILRTVRGLGWIAVLYRVPGLRGMADLLYRLIAKHRYRLFGKADDCDSGSCRLHK